MDGGREMTNGEIIHKQFPQAEIEMPTIFETKVKVLLDLDCTVKFPIEWWNAEYQDPTPKETLTEEDVLELKHRYGDEVEYVVKDMLSGENKRWEDLPTPKENLVEKQVILSGDGYADGKLVYDFGECPTCGRQWEDGDTEWEEPYCCHCGQKLHWFDKEAEDGKA